MKNREDRQYVYHYTDFRALDGILSDSELRVNNVLNMNDAQEMRLFMKGLCQAICDRLENYDEEDTARMVEKLFDKELENEFVYSAYAACFSMYRDDAAQWERYGNVGRGVCIVFDKEVLQRMVGGPISFVQVFYQDDMKGHKLVEEFLNVVRGESIQPNDIRLKTLFQKAWINSVAFKHPSFSSEREMRLVVSPKNGKVYGIQPKYHISNERIKKYYPLDLELMCEKADIGIEDLITELIIGPESTQSAPILRDYLCDLGLEELAEHISMSDCPLRHTNR